MKKSTKSAATLTKSTHEANPTVKCDDDDTNDEDELRFEVKNEANEAQARSHDANSSFIRSVVNMIGMLIGLDQLSTPYALQNGGWISSFLLISLGIVTACTSLLLGKCLETNWKTRNYTDINYQAFRRRGRAITVVIIYLEILMTLVSNTISLHDNLNKIFLGTHVRLSWAHHLLTSQVLTALAVLVVLPSLWLRDLSSILFLSTGGIVMSWMIFVAVVCTAVVRGVFADHAI